MFPLAVDEFSTAKVSIEDRSLSWEMLVSCIPEPGMGTGLSLTIPVCGKPISFVLINCNGLNLATAIFQGKYKTAFGVKNYLVDEFASYL